MKRVFNLTNMTAIQKDRMQRWGVTAICWCLMAWLGYKMYVWSHGDINDRAMTLVGGLAELMIFQISVLIHCKTEKYEAALWRLSRWQLAQGKK